MKSIRDADVIIALGTRLGPFGTLPQYGMEYWPKNAKIIQVDMNHRNLGLVRPADVTILADAKMAAAELLNRLKAAGPGASHANVKDRLQKLQQYRKEWTADLDKMTNGDPKPPAGKLKPRQALQELKKALPANAMVATDIGNVCSVSNSYLEFESSPSFLAAMTFGNCGYSFPAAMGAKVWLLTIFLATLRTARRERRRRKTFAHLLRSKSYIHCLHYCCRLAGPIDLPSRMQVKEPGA